MIAKVRVFLEMIKFEHTLFALPFAYVGAILGAVTVEKRLPEWSECGWILLAMIGARTAAMGLNRLIDKAIDARNPRTANRAIPAGLLQSKDVILYVIISFVLLFWASAQLNSLAVKLLPLAVFFLVFYSYTKRFTWTCHLVLGLTIGLAPLGGWVAVTGGITWEAIVLYVTVALWTAGFDVIYACQDVEFDRKEGLHSIPARFGIAKALGIARSFHALTAAGFALLLVLTDLSWWYFAGMIVAAALLLYEHRLVKPNDLSKLNAAFFTMNGILSAVIFVFTFIDLVVVRSW
ncbi:4-hydroxybenzoate octaprenyltransferase [Cohnella sp. CIP 111063]|uniref:UbiA-like polyprenyltransferase n=1 Tax=unclassified Cohnella TaxID=2636738 RepID=UPI000B8C593C|nr:MULTISPECIES: UbiA-like polyprenyltransferase [unclassified Cohnella]OXS61196.1 4-hydroxybenzoate octaprenyltransferase [Cohnella sp. CIP 111063]PRX73759.1 4-hydroxybenzoate polyprenyltransferase [Cohnella sp. SGD-V74]